MKGSEEEECNRRLELRLGVDDYTMRPAQRQSTKAESLVCLDLSFTLFSRKEALNVQDKIEGSSNSILSTLEKDGDQYPNYNTSEVFVANSNRNNGRKKLRLTKEQSILLEESFKLHTTLNPAQKHALADKLKLKPRQVEVWFQNRRARTKLKQTEVECEFLKKCCESLRDENRRLKKEVQALKSLKPGRAPSSVHLPEASVRFAMCPSCEKFLLNSKQEKMSPFCGVHKKR